MTRSWLYVTCIIAVTLLALGVRLRAVEMLPVDYDEDDYLGAAQRYVRAINAGDWGEVIHYDFNYEHPPLTKLVYGLAILKLPEAPLLPELDSTAPPAKSLPEIQFKVARLVSAAFGTLEVLALAILNPLAGFFLAINTWQIKYTSQIMLEPLPALTSTLAVLFYTRSRAKWNGWVLLSAIALGLTAASKYVYCLAGIAILADWLWVTRPASLPRLRSWSSEASFHREGIRLTALARWLGPVILWGVVSILVFVVFNPRLWAGSNPLSQALLYHFDYAQSEHVRRAGFPVWQPLVWLSMPVPWHPGVFLISIDLFVSLLAVLGLRRLWARQPVFALWLVIALLFLLVWPTKWPQYILILTAPLSLSAAEGARAKLWQPLLNWLDRLRSGFRARTGLSQGRLGWRDTRRALPWLLPGAIALSLIALFPLIYQAAMSLTDFNTISIRDGIQGGVWRAVWQGLTGQEKPVAIEILGGGSGGRQVHYAGPTLLLQLIFGGASGLLVFNVMWMVLSVGLQTLLGLGVALLLHRHGVRFRGWWRAVFILPWAIPEFVGALVWLRIFESRYGWLILAQNIPKDVPLPDYFENPNTALLILLIAATWYGFPFIMLAATAGLKLVPIDVYEAAAIDGASGWTQFRYVTLPLLFPLLLPAVIIRSIFAFNQFYLFIAMRTSPPLVTLATASYYIFSPTGYFGGQFAVSAAINLFTVLVLVVLILWFNRWSKAAEGVTYA